MDASQIVKLAPEVVNQIAAGEVIQRPSNALKELLENSLDAGATAIRVIVGHGGLKYLQISDNGHGISSSDFPLVCERFATSKLRKLEDLESIASFGFRGEALASISHVAQVSIISKTKAQACASKGSYRDGKLVSVPKPCAGTVGTQITVEDLFYNLKTRRLALKNTSEEYHLILDVMSKYAVHYGGQGISFCCKKQHDSTTDLNTMKQASVLDNIRVVYGTSVARELLALSYQHEKTAADEGASFQVDGYISNANFSLKKKNGYIFFVNHRLVTSSAMKRACDAIYGQFLPKHTYPFVYLHFQIPGTDIDVNVHPTKREVQMLYEEEIVAQLQELVQSKLQGANESRTFYTQTLLPGTSGTTTTTTNKKLPSKERGTKEQDLDKENEETKEIEVKKTKTAAVIAPQKKVRMDHRTVTMDQFLSNSQTQTLKRTLDTSKPRPDYTSLQELDAVIERKKSGQLFKFFQEHVFVGTVNEEFCLVQHQTKLFLVRFQPVLTEFFYQRTLARFGQHTPEDCVWYEERLSIVELLISALDNETQSGWGPEDGSKQDIAAHMSLLLNDKAPMLADYFGLGIVDQQLVYIPRLVPMAIFPSTLALPEFLLELANDVDWSDERECFDTIAQALGKWYSILNTDSIVEKHFESLQQETSQEQESLQQESSQEEEMRKACNGMLQHSLFPLLKSSPGDGNQHHGLRFRPSMHLKDKMDIMEVACLSNLYKIFERC